MKEQIKSRQGLKILLSGAGAGILLAVVVVLASGFMVELTNTDQFCITCHAMKPFRTSWREEVHGGRNPQGFAAQCVDCHLPHGNFIEYFTAKAITGTHDVIQNVLIDAATHDWVGNAEKNRGKFTYDSGCRHCHADLTPPGLPSGGLIAHRSYLRGTANRHCAECHPHVGHKDMGEYTEAFFKNEKNI